MVSGVSSTIRSQPVAFSMARMFRPSRPMMRPLRSSLGSWTLVTAVSATTSEATRWMAAPMVQRAFFSASSWASSSMRRTSFEASIRASCSSWAVSSRLASSRVRPEISSSRRACASTSRRASSCWPCSVSRSAFSFSALRSCSFCFWSASWSFLSRPSSLLLRRCSSFSRLAWRSFSSFSCSCRDCSDSSLALSSASLRIASDSRWARSRLCRDSRSASACAFSRICRASSSARRLLSAFSRACLRARARPMARVTARAPTRSVDIKRMRVSRFIGGLQVGATRTLSSMKVPARSWRLPSSHSTRG